MEPRLATYQRNLTKSLNVNNALNAVEEMFSRNFSEWNWAKCQKPAAIRNRRLTSESERPWLPVTKLGRLVKEGKVTSIEEILLRSFAIQEYQIIDHLLPNLQDKVLRVVPVQKRVRAGLRTRFKAFVAVGDEKGHVGLGAKCAKEVASAIRGALYNAKISIFSIRRGCWGSTCDEPHTLSNKVYGVYEDAAIAIYPAPRGCGIIGLSLIKTLLILAGVQDCFTSTTNFLNTGHLLRATINAIKQTYKFIDSRKKENLVIDSDGLISFAKNDIQWEYLKRKYLRVSCSDRYGHYVVRSMFNFSNDSFEMYTKFFLIVGKLNWK